MKLLFILHGLKFQQDYTETKLLFSWIQTRQDNPFGYPIDEISMVRWGASSGANMQGWYNYKPKQLT